MLTRLGTGLLVGALTVVAPSADAQQNHSTHHPPATVVQPAYMTDGEVRKIDRDAKKITLRHGEIKNLEMPAMTMAFQVKDPAMLDKVRAGDKVRFRVEKIGSTYTVTAIEPAK